MTSFTYKKQDLMFLFIPGLEEITILSMNLRLILNSAPFKISTFLKNSDISFKNIGILKLI